MQEETKFKQQDLMPPQDKRRSGAGPRFSGVAARILRLRKRYLIIIGLVMVGMIAFPVMVNKQVKRVNTGADLKYTPQDLMNNLDIRLAYLQSRTSIVSFYIHTIRSRENLWGLSKKKRYSVHTLLGCNPQMETYNVNVKQRVLIPSKPGTLHVVQPGDNWGKIVSRYKTKVNDLTEDELRRYNPWVTGISKGDMVFVPHCRPAMELMNDKMREKYEMRALFVYPIGGLGYTSVFGVRKHPVTGARSMHGGVDIRAREGTWVAAAADGVVTVASTGVGHYGTAVFIDHQNGYVTHYGHLSRILVRVGQKVKAGKLIARSGSTGRSTGPHLHFTIQKNGVNIDPLKFIW